MKKISTFLLLLSTLLLTACAGQEHFLYEPMTYSQLLRWQEGDGWTGIEVMDAWNEGQVMKRYVLVPRGGELPDELPEGEVVRVPLERAVLLSSVHGALYAELQSLDRVAGICDAEYVLNDSLHARLSDGRLADLGSSMQINTEAMVAVKPDAFFVSPFENAGYGQLETMKVPLITCADYMETSALGRAEWIKFYGRLMGRGAEADAVFAQVEKAYLGLCEQVKQVEHRPTLLCDLKQGSAWYVPGGKSYLGQLFADAGADYLFADQTESGSVALSFEKVFAKGREADYWLVKYGRKAPYTYETMAEDYPLYRDFRPWQQRKVLACNTFSVPYYEEVPFHPDRLLKNLIQVFHPGILPADSLLYYLPMDER